MLYVLVQKRVLASNWEMCTCRWEKSGPRPGNWCLMSWFFVYILDIIPCKTYSWPVFSLTPQTVTSLSVALLGRNVVFPCDPISHFLLLFVIYSFQRICPVLFRCRLHKNWPLYFHCPFKWLKKTWWNGYFVFDTDTFSWFCFLMPGIELGGPCMQGKQSINWANPWLSAFLSFFSVLGLQFF